MDRVKFVGFLSNYQRLSEDPFEENETRTVMTIDGYDYNSLSEHSSERLELFRIELFNPDDWRFWHIFFLWNANVQYVRKVRCH